MNRNQRSEGFNWELFAENRRQLFNCLAGVVARVRGIEPTHEWVATCDEAESTLRDSAGISIRGSDEGQLELKGIADCGVRSAE
jgi:hypothetical protein